MGIYVILWALSLQVLKTQGLPYDATYYFPLEVVQNNKIKGGSIDFSMNDPTMTLTEGVVGKALYLDGVDDCATIPLTALSDMGDCLSKVEQCSGLTLSFWLKLGTKPPTTVVIVTKVGNGQRKPGLRVVYNTMFQIDARVYSKWNYATVMSSPLSVGVWYHIGITWQKTTGISLLVDDNLFSANGAPAPMDDIGSQFPIGCSSFAPTTNTFNGYIDEMYLWNTAKSPAQFQTLQQQISQGMDGSLPGNFIQATYLHQVQPVLGGSHFSTDNMNNRLGCVGKCATNQVCAYVTWEESTTTCFFYNLVDVILGGSTNSDVYVKN